jgi:hypothetical protein
VLTGWPGAAPSARAPARTHARTHRPVIHAPQQALHSHSKQPTRTAQLPTVWALAEKTHAGMPVARVFGACTGRARTSEAVPSSAIFARAASAPPSSERHSKACSRKASSASLVASRMHCITASSPSCSHTTFRRSAVCAHAHARTHARSAPQAPAWGERKDEKCGNAG